MFIFIEIQAWEYERIFGCLKVLNMISRQKRFKKIIFFYLKIKKKSLKEIYFGTENLTKLYVFFEIF